MVEEHMLIDESLPVYDVVERHHTEVRAPVERVYDAVRRLDLGSSATIRSLFWLRELPARLRRSDRCVGEGDQGLTLDALLESGFVLLGERPNRELVLGLVGRFWTTSGDLQRLDASEFHDFGRPGYAKTAWNFSVTEQHNGTTLLATETRVLCLDVVSRRRFRLYWTLIGPFSGLIRKVILRSIKRQAEFQDPPMPSGEAF